MVFQELVAGLFENRKLKFYVRTIRGSNNMIFLISESYNVYIILVLEASINLYDNL